MKAMILCGGQGTRLREHTELRPKPMVEIGGRPILWHIMKWYAKHGITDFVLCLGYKANMIKEYFLNYEAMNNDFTLELGSANCIQYHGQGHQERGWKVTLAYTGEKTMTGARIKRAAAYLGPTDETFCVTYGDGLSDVDLQAALRFHRAHGTCATLVGVRPPSRFGELETNGDHVVAFTEKSQIGNGLINGGFFFFEPRFLDYLNDTDDCILERAPLEKCAADGQLNVYHHNGFWQCMDTIRDWELLERLWENDQAPWRA